ncbi:hypothetical protein M7I_7100 [Glarea lozoyensis 74030]|uniref:Uncharacterized protein n=1 Tax=Glarea lozoyensis (strain ATCC 74030 / MF5533) TaxID=1104152 RepID=H0EWD5_GLAL7|nr:hypothetical protein M7I_7100 [Glarea lozoyensis 74030]
MSTAGQFRRMTRAKDSASMIDNLDVSMTFVNPAQG